MREDGNMETLCVRGFTWQGLHGQYSNQSSIKSVPFVTGVCGVRCFSVSFYLLTVHHSRCHGGIPLFWAVSGGRGRL